MEDLISLDLLLRAKAEGLGELEHAHNLLLGLAAGALAAGVAMVGGFAAGAIAAGKSVIDQAQAVEKLHKAYGASTESIQMWHGALMLAGDDSGAFDSALQKVSMRLGLLKVQFDATGKVSKTGAMFFKEAGISAEQLAHAKPDQLIMMIAQGLEKIQDPAMRAAVGIRTLGSGWKDIVDTLEKSGGTMDDFNRKVKDSGYIMDDAMIAKAQKSEMSLNLLHLQFKGITNTIGVAMLPAFDAFSNFIESNMGYFKEFANVIGTTVIPAVLSWATAALPVLIARIKDLVGWVKNDLIPHFKIWGGILAPLVEIGKQFVEKFLAQFSGDKGRGASDVLDLITSALKTATPIIEELLGFLGDHPKLVDAFLLAFIANKAAGPAIQSLLGPLQGFASALSPIAGGLGGAAKGGKGVFDFFTKKTGGVGGATLPGMGPAVEGQTGAAAMFEKIGSMAGGAVSGVARLGVAMWGFAGAAWAAILPLLPLILIIGGLILIGVLLYTHWKELSSMMAIIFKVMGQVVMIFVHAAIGYVTSMVTGMKSAWNTIVADVSGAWTNVSNFITGAWNKITGVFSGAWQAMWGVGGNIVHGLEAGLKGAWDGFMKTFRDLASKLPDPIKKLMHISSPSGVFSDIAEQGIMGGLTQGILRGAPAVNRALQGAVSTAPLQGPSFSGGNAAGGTMDVLMKRLIDLQTEANGILSMIAAKDLNPAVSKAFANHMAGARP